MTLRKRLTCKELSSLVGIRQRSAGKWATGTTGQKPCALVDVVTVDFKGFFDPLQGLAEKTSEIGLSIGIDFPRVTDSLSTWLQSNVSRQGHYHIFSGRCS